MIEIAARGIVIGKASGPALVSAEAVSFLGDVDIRSGRVGRRPCRRSATLRARHRSDHALHARVCRRVAFSLSALQARQPSSRDSHQRGTGSVGGAGRHPRPASRSSASPRARSRRRLPMASASRSRSKAHAGSFASSDWRRRQESEACRAGPDGSPVSRGDAPRCARCDLRQEVVVPTRNDVCLALGCKLSWVTSRHQAHIIAIAVRATATAEEANSRKRRRPVPWA